MTGKAARRIRHRCQQKAPYIRARPVGRPGTARGGQVARQGADYITLIHGAPDIRHYPPADPGDTYGYPVRLKDDADVIFVRDLEGTLDDAVLPAEPLDGLVQ